MTQEVKRIRRTAEESRKHILDSALSLAQSLGIKNFSSTQLGDFCNYRHALIFYYFKDMDNLRDEVMRLAIVNKNVAVLAQGLAARDPIANSAPEKLKKQALSSLQN